MEDNLLDGYRVPGRPEKGDNGMTLAVRIVFVMKILTLSDI